MRTERRRPVRVGAAVGWVRRDGAPSHAGTGVTTARRPWRGALLGVALACTACDPEPTPDSGAPVARVDGTEVTAGQLDAELAQRMGASPGTQDAAALRVQAAETLVERTLLANAAVAAGLDQDPAVVEAIARARAEVLASAWLARRVDASPGPSESEVRAWYDAHPELYAKRTVFHLRQVSSGAAIEMAEIRAAAESLPGPQALLEWFRQRGAPAQLRSVALASEHVAPALRERLAALSPGQAVLVHNGDQVQVHYLVQARAEPVSFAAARPAIAGSLAESNRRERIRAEIERLRAQADIVWLGDLADQVRRARPAPAAGADGAQVRTITTPEPPPPAPPAPAPAAGTQPAKPPGPDTPAPSPEPVPAP